MPHKPCPPCPPPSPPKPLSSALLPLETDWSSNRTCFPEIAGWGSCTTSRNGKPGYTPPTIDIVAGPIQCGVICRTVLLSSKDGATLLADIEANDPRPDDAWDFGTNLLKDNIQRALIFFFDRAANQLTRGTWTGAEVAGHGLTSVGSGASTVTSDTLPPFFKQLFVYDHPIKPELWIGRAIPREWLGAGQRVATVGAPTRGGRVDLMITVASTGTSCAVNVSLPSDFTWPAGGLVVRLRSPGYPVHQITNATLGGKASSPPTLTINSTEESVRIASPPENGLVALQDIVVYFS